MGSDWLHDAVMYEVYPQSFADSNGDGIGDLRGVIERLDHIASLGVDTAVSLPPVGVTELASGLAALFGDSTKRIWVYLPAGNGVWPSSTNAPLVSDSRSTRFAG